jgi:hypothetical protein
MVPRRLTEDEFRATFSEKMVDIKDREDTVQPEGVIDLEPYLKSIPPEDFGDVHLMPGVPPAAVYRCQDDRFDHVLYPCSRSNLYLVVVIALRPDRVHGHYFLDLNEEYGFDRAV